MRRAGHFLLLTAFGLSVVAAGGCGGGDNRSAGPPSAKEKLEEVAQMLRSVEGDKQKPPAGPSGLAAVEPYLPLSANDIRSGELVYLWGATLGTGANASSTVVAYEKKAPTDGGWVLLQDGKVKQMTAQEFASAPKAKK